MAIASFRTFKESEDIDGTGYDYVQCCKDQQVKKGCQYICDYNGNINFLAYNSTCYSEMDKIMVCGSRYFNYQQCCVKNNVPEECLGWCLPKSVLPAIRSNNFSSCATHIKTVAKCFSEEPCNKDWIGNRVCENLNLKTKAECNHDGGDCCDQCKHYYNSCADPRGCDSKLNVQDDSLQWKYDYSYLDLGLNCVDVCLSTSQTTSATTSNPCTDPRGCAASTETISKPLRVLLVNLGPGLGLGYADQKDLINIGKGIFK